MERIIISATILLLTACASQAPAPEPGFEVIDYDRDGEIQLALDVDWSSYTKVHLETATVEFRDNWVRDQKRLYDNVIREKDEVRIKTGASDLLERVLTRELSNEGAYEIVDEGGPGVMRWTPRIVKLDVIAPDRVKNTVSESLVDSQGSFTIELEIHDSVSGKLLATATQYQSDPYKGYLERTTSATNTQAFRLMMQRWADWLLDNLASVRTDATE
jgi:hypothetical protein